MKDVAKVSVDMLSKRELLRGNATERKEVTQISVADQLKELALEFAKWQKPQAKQQETLDVETVEIIEQDEDDATMQPMSDRESIEPFSDEEN